MSTLKAMDQMFNLLDDIFHKPPPKAVSMLEGFIEMDSGRHRTEIRWRRPPSLKEAKKFVGSGKRGCVEIVWCEGPTEDPAHTVPGAKKTMGAAPLSGAPEDFGSFRRRAPRAPISTDRLVSIHAGKRPLQLHACVCSRLPAGVRRAESRARSRRPVLDRQI